jgi:LysR family transcriptional regulator, glycine cleavage system transcriptional activator
MKASRRTLSLVGLRDFEAAARSGSFAGAGLELGVSASAVSQQVKILEERLGIRLFDRRPQSLSVTAPGRKLLATLTNAFDQIELSLSSITLTPPKNRITLAMPAVFAVSWFLPRMQRFRANYPFFEIVPRSSGGVLEPSIEGVDASIRHGRAGWGSLDCRFLFGDVLLPLCSPHYVQSSSATGLELNCLRDHKLLESETSPALWEEWSSANSVHENLSNVFTFGDDSLVVQAALNGHGVALLDCSLLSELVTSGQLVPFVAFHKWLRGTGWYLVFEERQHDEEIFTALIDWILDEVNNVQSGLHR